MARGWESKSVEEQIDMAQDRTLHVVPPHPMDPQEQELVRRRETLMLSRTRVVHDLNCTQNPRYKGMLTKALADLEAQIAAVRGH